MPTTYWLKFGNTPLGYNGSALKTEYIIPGSLSVTCNASISGSGFDTTKQFGCTITFNAVVPYTLDGVAQTPASSVHLLLTKDQTAVLGGIPAGTTYSITEDAISQADQDLGYFNGTVTGATGTIGEGTASLASIGLIFFPVPQGNIRYKFPSGHAPVSDPSTVPDYTWTAVSQAPDVWDLSVNGNFGFVSWMYSQLKTDLAAAVAVVSADCAGKALTYKRNDVSYGIFSRSPSITHVGPLKGVTGSLERLFMGCSRLVDVTSIEGAGIVNVDSMFRGCTSLVSAPLFDTSEVGTPYTEGSYVVRGSFASMFYECTSLKQVPLYNTGAVYSVSGMFYECTAVESGALALYNQMAGQATPPTSHNGTFHNCGANTTTGAAELAQIPSDWK